MFVSELIEYLENVLEVHGDLEVRTVTPQYRSTQNSQLQGAFPDSEGLVLVTKERGDYFDTDSDEDYDNAQSGDFIH